MFGNLGIGEIIIIAGIALVILGPEKFPEYAKIAMRAYRDLRGYVEDIKREMAEELQPVKREIQQLAQHNPEDYIENLAKAVAAIDDQDSTTKAEEPQPQPAEHPPQDSTPTPEASAASAPAEPPKQPEESPERLDG
jgi:Tat protein translocase TatB subunit